MNGPIRLVLSDVDGTLVTTDKVLTEKSIQAVDRLRDAGILFAAVGMLGWQLPGALVATRVALGTPSPDAALRIIKGIENNEPRILIGNDARFMDILQRFRPATYWSVLARRLEKAANAGK